jgi:glutamate racemase
VFAELGRRFLGPEIGSVETTPAGAAPDGTPDGTPDGAGDGTAPDGPAGTASTKALAT